MEITKTIEISTGHRLHLHNGGCYNLHGHNYKITVKINFEEILDDFIEGIGFFVDFKVIKEVLNEGYDHKFLLFKDDPYLEKLKEMPGIQIVDYAPTAENISKDMVNKIGNVLAKLLEAKKVTTFRVHIQLYETSSACAEYSKLFNLKNQ